MPLAAPRIVLFHATQVAMEPVRTAMLHLWPQAEVVNLLDETLSIDRAKDGEQMSQTLSDRFVDLGRHARHSGADGILITCSAFGPAIDRMAAELPIPVLRPNEAMFRAALGTGRRIAMLATFAPAVPTMEEEFMAFATEIGVDARIDTVVVDGAMDCLRHGDAVGHNRLVAAAASRLEKYDAIMLAQFSTSRAAAAVREVTDVPVLTAPESAVLRMRTLIEGEGGC